MTILLSTGFYPPPAPPTQAVMLLTPITVVQPPEFAHVALFVVGRTALADPPRIYGIASLHGTANRPDTVVDQPDPSAHGIASFGGHARRDYHPWNAGPNLAIITRSAYPKKTLITRSHNG